MILSQLCYSAIQRIPICRMCTVFITLLSQQINISCYKCYASAVYAVIVCPSVCPSVRHEPVLHQKNWTNRAGFWHGGFLTPIPPCAVKKFGYLQKLRNFSLELCTKFRTQKISSRQVDRVVNKTRCRRRRRSSLLTTSIRQSTSRGCLLQVGHCNPKLHYFDLLWICCTTCFYS